MIETSNEAQQAVREQGNGGIQIHGQDVRPTIGTRSFLVDAPSGQRFHINVHDLHTGSRWFIGIWGDEDSWQHFGSLDDAVASVL